MRVTAVLLVFLILIAGCSDIITSQNIDTSESKIVKQNAPKKQLIDCSSFNSKPELWYIKSGSNVGYYVYIPAQLFKHPRYTIGVEQIEDEEKFNLTTNDKIQRHAKYCSFGRVTGQNINYLYCENIVYDAPEISGTGQIISRNLLAIKTTFSIDNKKELQETKGGYKPVEDSQLISQECWLY